MSYLVKLNDQRQRWVDKAVRRGALIGAISAWATPDNKPGSAERCLAEIRRLIAEYDAEQTEAAA